MIKPASSLCNLKCGYCFYNDVSEMRQQANFGIMTLSTAQKIISNIFCEPLNYVTFGFQGGEPTLAGLEFFQFFVDEVNKISHAKVRYAFQTNGLTVDKSWLQFFKENKFLLGLSLDGDAGLHNVNRKDAQNKATYNRVISAKKQLDLYNVDYNILCVLTKETSRRAKRIWDFILSENINYIQFIPCLESLEVANLPNFAALTSEKFYRFYAELFTLWKKEVYNGNFVHVQLFDDLATLLLSKYPVTCGINGRCIPQIVVESDGSVYPCDFYAIDEYKIGNLAEQPVAKIVDKIISSGFLQNNNIKNECFACNYAKWCNGGCKRMQKAMYNKNGFCGMKSFLDEFLADLLAVYKNLI